ncbi:MAG TPA: 16S rRNA (cytosine(1402)-N(4))-methyltransferase RsmH [Planctomycetota bacterium]|jgi:16S rRNA (cytosine1402-N4)-methyltransferase
MSEAEPEAEPGHRSVLLRETIELLALQPGQCVIDCTLGAGGHSSEIIGHIKPGGRLIGLDVDPQALELARQRLQPLADAANVKLELLRANFNQLETVWRDLGSPAVHAIVADLGVSSMQFDTPERGFSFRFDNPLDMRMDPSLQRSAADILRESSEEVLADIFFYLGEERRSRQIAREIVYRRQTEPITTTGQLEALVRRVLRVKRWQRIHPATRVFQALRLAVNQELESLTELLTSAPEVLSDGGTLAIITFHSLEDRQVKQRFKALVETGRFLRIVKFVSPGEEELKDNPRSRSAKLRAIRKAVLRLEA